MRLVEGSDLAWVLADAPGGLDPSRAVRIVVQVAGALSAAHADGLVHRDVKPSNVLLTSDDHAYLVDFGIAHSASATVLTGTGATLGTAHYMAPESFLTGRGDHRIDIYALGCLLYETLAGRPPFDGEGAAAQMYAHVHQPPPCPSTTRPGLPPALDAVVAAAMAKNPDDRPNSAQEFADLARTAVTTPQSAAAAPIPTRIWATNPTPASTSRDPRRSWILAGAAVVVAAALLATGVLIGTQVAGQPTRSAASQPSSAPATTTSGATSSGSAAPPTTIGRAGTGEVGQVLRNGGITLTVINVARIDSIDLNESSYQPGSGFETYTSTPAGPDAAFIVVSTHIVNDSNGSLDLTCGFPIKTVLSDDRNRRFDTIDELYKLRDNPECNANLQPGFEDDMSYVYRIPTTTTITGWSFLDLSEDLGSTAPPTPIAINLPGA